MEKRVKVLDHVAHILTRPTMYIGEVEPREKRVLVLRDGRLVSEKLQLNPGLVHVVNEILQNARDHAINDAACNAIEVTQRGDELSVRNNGNGVCTDFMPEHGRYLPEVIFGVLMSSTNYEQDAQREEETIVGGQNGYGAKLTNIFSTRFVVETVFERDGKRTFYSQAFSANMRQREPPTILESDAAPYTRITFVPDAAIFRAELPAELLQRMLVDIAFTLRPIKRVTVSFNGVTLPSPSLEEYYALLNGTECFFVHESRHFQLLVALGRAETVAFVNSLEADKGTHVDLVFKSVTRVFTAAEKDRDKKELAKATVRANVFLLLNAVVPQPRFDSQAKQRLVTTKLPELQLDEKAFMQSELFRCLREKIAQQQSILKETRRVDEKKLHAVEKLRDAPYAGGVRSAECILIVCEGDSASGFSDAGLQCLTEEERKRVGIYALGGKFINVRNQPADELNKNKRFAELREILGLRFKSQEGMRYGKLLVMADQDFDGFHIKGLIINMIDVFWRPLLKDRVFVFSYRTPVVKVFQQKKLVRQFFNFTQYQQWAAQHKDAKFDVKYYKGLGTSSDDEAKESFRHFFDNMFSYRITTPEDEAMLDKAFNCNFADTRKDIIREGRIAFLDYERAKEVSCAEYVRSELVHFWHEDNTRSIPQLYDGLKDSQRRILTTALHKLRSEKKINILTGNVIEFSDYHHGEASLQDTIVKMAQHFQGTNNIHYFEPCGQFGNVLGKEASQVRYISVAPHALIRRIFPDKLLPVLPRDAQEETEVPQFLFPIIPMLLVNGCQGIGTGFSSQSPKFHPRELAALLVKMLRGEEADFALLPFYKHYSRDFKFDGTRWTHTARFDMDLKKNRVVLHELPLGYTYERYKADVLLPLLNRDVIKNVTDPIATKGCISKVTIAFRDYDLDDATPAEVAQLLHLTHHVSFQNSHFFVEGTPHPVRFESLRQVMEEYVRMGVQLYDRYRLLEIETQLRQAELLKHRLRLMRLVQSGDLRIQDLDEEQLGGRLEAEGIPRAFHDELLRTSIRQLTRGCVEELGRKVETCDQQVQRLRATTPQQLWEEDVRGLPL